MANNKNASSCERKIFKKGLQQSQRMHATYSKNIQKTFKEKILSRQSLERL
jgi:hypothetical protein